MSNKIISIGCLGNYDCYLNIEKDEAISRYSKRNDIPIEQVIENCEIEEIEFEDEFAAYSVYNN